MRITAPKPFAADLVDRQAVDLADALAAGGYQQHAAPHRVGQPLVDAAGTLAPRRDGGAHVVALDGGARRRARWSASCSTSSRKRIARAQARAVFGQARAVVDAGGQRRGVGGQEAGLARLRARSVAASARMLAASRGMSSPRSATTRKSWSNSSS